MDNIIICIRLYEFYTVIYMHWHVVLWIHLLGNGLGEKLPDMSAFGYSSKQT